MILKSKHHRVIYPFFKLFTLFKISSHFRKVIIKGSFNEDRRPVLVISNHSGWWDGFILLYLNMKIFKRKFHFMMLENQLRKYWYFNYAGGFSIKKGSRTALESLSYTSELLKVDDNLVLIFPQGEIVTSHTDRFVFEKGIERLYKEKGGSFRTIFHISLTDYFSSPKPTLYCYIKEQEVFFENINDISNSFNSFYLECINIQKAIRE